MGISKKLAKPFLMRYVERLKSSRTGIFKATNSRDNDTAGWAD